MNIRAKLLLDYYFGGFLHAILKLPTILLGKILRSDHDLKNCQEIAVLKLLGGGSLVIAYPALLALKRLPHIRRLKLITTPAIKPFGEVLGIFDEIIVIRDNGLVALAKDSAQAFRRLFACDAIIDLEIHSRLTTVFMLLTCARNRIGFFTNISFWRQHLNTHLLFCNVSNGIYSFYDQIAAIFGATSAAYEECRGSFRGQLGTYKFEGDRARLAIAPVCSGLSKERMLLPEEWIRILSERLLPRGDKANIEIHLLGGPADRPELEELKALIEASFPFLAGVWNYAGKTKLRESVQILDAMDEVLCIDSSLLHFSRLLGRRTTSYWGPTDPRTLARPNDNGMDEIHYVKISCSPCVHMSHQPPCKGNNICMRLAANPDASVLHNPAWLK